MIKEREHAFDILRVISMIMVIVVHVSNIYARSFGVISNKDFLISLIFNTLPRISVPIFLMISGVVLFDREFNKNKYFGRIKRFLIITIFWTVAYLLWEYFYLGKAYNSLHVLLYKPYRAHLWFLYTMLIIYTIQPLMKKIFEKTNITMKILLLLIWVIFSSLGMFNSTIAKVFTEFSHIGFFIVGRYLYVFIKKHDLKKYNTLLILLIIIFIAAGTLLNYFFSIKQGDFCKLYSAYRTPFIIIPSLSFFTLVCSNYNKNSVSKFIKILSEVSLGVYLIHGIFLDITSKLFTYSSITPFIGIPIFTFIIAVLSIISTYLLKKTKFLKNII